jgi:DNA-binding transcriptional LysR family regulator
MHLDQLRTFVLAAEHGGLTGASDLLNRSLPALSRRVALLEAELGVPLLERRGRRLALTLAGNELLPRARRVLDELDEAVLLMKQTGTALRGSVSIACIPSGVRLVARFTRPDGSEAVLASA